MNFHLSKWFRHVTWLGLIIPSLLFNIDASAQSSPGSEAQLIKDAGACFDNQDYSDAFPLYSQLLSLYPNNSQYNYRLGACMLFIKSDKEKPIDYISTAIKQAGVDHIAWYYLGRAYHLNYKFDAAIRAYRQFQQIASSSEIKKYPVAHLIEMCNNAKSLLKNMQELDVLVKKEVGSSDYFQAYDLSNNGGSVIVEPDDFKTKLDKKKGATSVMYLSADKNILFFSSYGDNDKNGKDIYEKKRLPDGSFGKPISLGNVINTQYDEDFPFYDEPTHTLYFCSKGHNSMGGYDVFKSSFDAATQTWSEPVNMDFPINTPDDDILFIADTLNQTAYFASTRESPLGSIDIYKIKLLPHPPEFLAIKGITYGDTGNTPTTSRITVKDFRNDQMAGIYNSSQQNGSYLMNLANGGKFVFTVETQGHKTQSEPVILPLEPAMVTLKQIISYEQGTDKLIIRNGFETRSDSDYLLAMNYIKQKAQMEVHIDTTKPAVSASQPITVSSGANNSATNLSQPAKQDTGIGTAPANNSYLPSFANSQNGDMTDKQLVRLDSEDARQQQNNAKNLKEDADKATNFANDKLMQAEEMKEQARMINDSAANLSNPEAKKDSLAKAASLTAQANELENKALEAYQIAAQEQTDAAAKQQQADLSTDFARKLDSAAKTTDNRSAITDLQKQQSSLRQQQKAAPAQRITPAMLINRQAENVKLDSVQLAKQTEELQKSIPQLQQESQNYINQAQNTQNQQEKIALLQQAKDLSESKKQKEQELALNTIKEKQIGAEHAGILAAANTADSSSRSAGEGGSPRFADSSGIKQEIAGYSPAATQGNSSSANTNRLKTSADTALTVSASGINNHSATAETANQNSNNGLPGNQFPAQGTNTSLPGGQGQNSNAQSSAATANQQLGNNAGNQQTGNLADNNHIQSSDTGLTNRQAANTNSNTSTDNNSSGNDASNQSVNKQTIPATAVYYSNQEVRKTGIQGEKQITDAKLLSDRAQELRIEAEETKDTGLAPILYRRADSLDHAGDREKLLGVTASMNADTNQFLANSQILTAWSGYKATQGDTDKITTARLLVQDANFYYSKSLSEKRKADNMGKSYLKETFMELAKQDIETALLKQQNAENIYLNYNPALANSQRTPASNQINLSSTQSATNMVQNSATAAQGNNAVAQQNQGSNIADNNNANGAQQQTASSGVQNSASAMQNNITTTQQNQGSNIADNNNANGAQQQTASGEVQNQTTTQNNNAATQQNHGSNIADNNNANGAQQQTTSGEVQNQSTTQNNNATTQQNQGSNTADNNNANGAQQQTASSGVQNQSTTQNNNASIQQNQGNNTADNNNANGTQQQTASSGIQNSAAVQNNNAAAQQNQGSIIAGNNNTSGAQQQSDSGKTTSSGGLVSVTQARKIDSALSGSNAVDTQRLASITGRNASSLNNAIDTTPPVASTPDSSLHLTRHLSAYTVAPAADLTVSITITRKASITGFAKFEETVPDGFTVQALKKSGASFTFDNNKVKFVWFDLPKESSFTVSYLLTPNSTTSGKQAITGEFSYLLDQSATTLHLPSSAFFVGSQPPTFAANIIQNGNAAGVQNQPNGAGGSQTVNGNNTTAKGNGAGGSQVQANSNGAQTQGNNAGNSEVNSSQNTQGTNNNQSTANGAIAVNNQNAQNTGGSTQVQENGTVAANNGAVTNASNASQNPQGANSNQSDANGGVASNNQNAQNTGGNQPLNNNTQENANINQASGNITTTGDGGNEQNRQNNNSDAAANNNSAVNVNSGAGANTVANGNADGNTGSNPTTASLSADVFGELRSSPYSAAKPIPVDAPLPSGLIYKVQVGAFRNPIPQNLFKGLNPISGERTASGLTRYTAGLFKEYNGARDAQDKIHQLGYRDAFVVAFLNGKRIPLNQAGGQTANGGNQIAADNTPPVHNNAIENTGAGGTTPDAATATSVKSVQGLFYTVQVGAFQHKVPAAMLYHLAPLFSYLTPNGFIRYNCGIYSSATKAADARQSIISRTPAKDAFVVAYYNGDRIDIAKAGELLSKGSAAVPQNTDLDRMPLSNTNNNANNTVKAENTTAAITPALNDSSGKVVFKVQVGAYSGQIPVDMANNLLKISGQGLQTHKENNGVTTYTLGGYADYTSASLLKQELIKGGFPQSFIVAYSGEKRINLKEAQMIKNK